MNDRITRRDFLDGMACAIVAGAAPQLIHSLEGGMPYPPARTKAGFPHSSHAGSSRSMRPFNFI